MAARISISGWTAGKSQRERMETKAMQLNGVRTTQTNEYVFENAGRRAEARDLVAPVYCWFTEGFDTPDLKYAEALLGHLGGA